MLMEIKSGEGVEATGNDQIARKVKF